MINKVKNLIHFTLYVAFIAIFVLGYVERCGAENSLLLHVGSKHGEANYYDKNTFESKPYNAANSGVGVEYDRGVIFPLRAGIYKNSYNNVSVYFGGFPNVHLAKRIRIGAQIGIVTGYGEYAPPFMILPTISANYYGAIFEVGYIPKVSENTVSLITFTTGFKF